jgi:tRNA-2-methylthio-N6-dimethylallyladenosine synthase
MAVEKTFYLETFGCQMNVHDSEKVIGTLQHEGYRQVDSEADAGLILYNTCSIRDKAEQKVFNRLNDYKKLHKQGKRFAVLGCVAQQEGERIFERAPYVSLVSGSASYRKLPEMLVRLEAGEKRITGLDDRTTNETFETEFTARSNPWRGYITIIEGCDKFCAYCVVPYTRGKERSRGSTSVMEEARRMAEAGYTEVQLLGQNVNSYRDPEGKRSFAELLAAIGGIPGIRRVRFTTSHPRDFTPDIVAAINAVPTLCDHVHLPAQSGSTAVLKAMNREYSREQYLERISWIQSSKRPISLTTDIIVGFPGETPDDFIATMDLLAAVQYDAVFAFMYSPRPNTPAINMADSIPEAEKSRRLQVLLDRQREIQRINYNKHVGEILEVMVEAHNPAREQVIGRTSQNKTLNFTVHQPILPAPGSYSRVLVTRAQPNSLVGEAVA